MFRTPTDPNLPPSLPKPENGMPAWADGFFYKIHQSNLDFGRNRKEPVEWRPFLTLLRHEPAISVLPCTTRGKHNHPDYFAVPPDQARFKTEQAVQSFLFYHYETLHPSKLGQKIGLVSHSTRLDVMAWIIKRYSEQ